MKGKGLKKQGGNVRIGRGEDSSVMAISLRDVSSGNKASETIE